MSNRYFIENAANGVPGDVVEADTPEKALDAYAANCIGYTTPEMLIQAGYVVRKYVWMSGKSMAGNDMCSMGEVLYPNA